MHIHIDMHRHTQTHVKAHRHAQTHTNAARVLLATCKQLFVVTAETLTVSDTGPMGGGAVGK